MHTCLVRKGERSNRVTRFSRFVYIRKEVEGLGARLRTCLDRPWEAVMKLEFNVKGLEDRCW